MKPVKLLVILAAVVFAAVLIYTLVGMLIGVVLSLVWYAFVFALAAAAGYGVYKLFAGKNESRRLESRDDLLIENREFERADRLLSEYKKKLSTKD